jgi:integrase
MLIKRGSTFHSRIMFDGRLYQRSLRTRNRATAVKFEALFRAGLIKGEFGIIETKQTPTLAQFETRLLPHWEANCAPRTFGFYKQNLAALNKFAPLAYSRLHKIDAAIIEKFIQFRLKDDKKPTPVTVNHALRTLRRVLYIARDWKLIRDVPRIKMLPGENERDFVLDDETVNKMVEWLRATYPTSRFHLMLPFLVDTGLRITEACNLQKEHIEFKDEIPCSIKIVKGKSKYARREIPLTDRAAYTLAASLVHSKCAYAFTSKGGHKPITRHYPSEQFRAVRDALEIGPECVLHSTRHTFCTRLGKAGADAFTIQKLAGHSSITISQRYVHADKEIKESAIRLLDVLNQPKIEN